MTPTAPVASALGSVTDALRVAVAVMVPAEPVAETPASMTATEPPLVPLALIVPADAVADALGSVVDALPPACAEIVPAAEVAAALARLTEAPPVALTVPADAVPLALGRVTEAETDAAPGRRTPQTKTPGCP